MADPTGALPELTDFLEELEQKDARKLVVRWVDETRPVAADESGYTVRRVTRATITARCEGEPVQRTFEDIGYDELRAVVDRFPFETLYRSDNVTR